MGWCCIQTARLGTSSCPCSQLLLGFVFPVSSAGRCARRARQPPRVMCPACSKRWRDCGAPLRCCVICLALPSSTIFATDAVHLVRGAALAALLPAAAHRRTGAHLTPAAFSCRHLLCQLAAGSRGSLACFHYECVLCKKRVPYTWPASSYLLYYA